MAGAGSWFYVWVPSREHERLNRSRSRSNSKEHQCSDYLDISSNMKLIGKDTITKSHNDPPPPFIKQFSREPATVLPVIKEVLDPVAAGGDTTPKNSQSVGGSSNSLKDLFNPPPGSANNSPKDRVSGLRENSPKFLITVSEENSPKGASPESTRSMPATAVLDDSANAFKYEKSGSIPTSTPNIVELKPTRAETEICIDDCNADYGPKDESIDMDNISRRTLDPCGSINSETCLLSDTKEENVTKETILEDTTHHNETPFEAHEDEEDNDSDGSDGEETKIEFKTEHEDKYDDEKYDHDNDISKEIDKSTLSFVEWEPMEDICRKMLEKMKINPVSIQKSANKTQVLFLFFVPYDFIESVLLEFQNQGIGSTGESTLSVVPANIHYSTQSPPFMPKSDTEEVRMDSFYSSVKSRLLVAEVIARIQAGADFSFDYLLLLILAGMIAFMGLVESSSVVLVASMLVSPLMGPILAGIFGGVIQDPGLTKKGIIHESISLLICIAIGFLLGLMISPIAEYYGCPQWPTTEMLSRGEARALWVGILIAVPSGAGVALSVLGGNAGSLVGVAISASLLPPAVNCGIFWALALCITIQGDLSFASFHGFGEELDPLTNLTVSMYQPKYSDSFALEAFLLGLISLLLTLVNIVCIIFTGVAILRLKEVTPAKIPQKFSNFWRRDVKAHRNYYKTLTKEDNEKLLSELQAMGLAKKASEGLEGTFLQSMFERASHDNDLINIKDWVAMPSAAEPPKTTCRVPVFRVFSGDETEDLLSPNVQVTEKKKFNSGEKRQKRDRSRSPYNPYATFHGRNNLNSFVDMSNFFHSELRRSRDFRKRLYTAESHASYVP